MIEFRQKDFSLISRGVRFIKELRTIEPLPINLNEYERLLYGGFVYNKSNNSFDFKEDDKELNKLNKKIDDYYKVKDSCSTIASIGRTYCDSFYPTRLEIFNDLKKNLNNRSKKYWEAIEFSYNKVNKLPKRYLTKLIDNGYSGIIFNYPGNKIEKISFLGFTKREYDFYNYLLYNPIKVFPKIYDLENDQVIMEKLDVESPKIKECKEYISKYIIKKDLSNGFRDKKPNWDLMNKELDKNNWFYKFLKEVEEGIYKIFKIKSIGDFHSGNIGERKNGDLVYFDPIGGLLAMEGK